MIANAAANPRPAFEIGPAFLSGWAVMALRSMPISCERLKVREICCGLISPVELMSSSTPAKPSETAITEVSAIGSTSKVGRPGALGSAGFGSSETLRSGAFGGSTGTPNAVAVLDGAAEDWGADGASLADGASADGASELGDSARPTDVNDKERRPRPNATQRMGSGPLR